MTDPKLQLRREIPPVFFLGAGASVVFEYPTTTKFMEAATDVKFGKLFGDVLEYLKRDNKERIIDIELVLWELQRSLEIFHEIEKGNTFLRYMFIDSGEWSGGRFTQYRGNIDQLIQQINKLVYDTYWGQDGVAPQNLYEVLFEPWNTPLDVFTTNYDRVIEQTYWDHEKIADAITDGFKSLQRGHYWTEELLDGNFRIRLHKLHGSITWKKKNGRLYRTNEPDFTSHDEQLMIYPGWKGKPSETPYRELHDRLAAKLNDPNTEHCISIGFSFRDDYINQLFQNAFQSNPHLKLIVWNPTNPLRDEIKFPAARCEFWEGSFDREKVDIFLKRYLG